MDVSFTPSDSRLDRAHQAPHDDFRFCLTYIPDSHQCVKYPDMSHSSSNSWDVELKCSRNRTTPSSIGFRFDLFRKDSQNRQVLVELEVQVRDAKGSDLFRHCALTSCPLLRGRTSCPFFLWVSSGRFRGMSSEVLQTDIDLRLKDARGSAVDSPARRTVEALSRVSLQNDWSLFFESRAVAGTDVGADVVLVAADGGRSSAHGVVLGVRSPVFRDVLTGGPQVIEVPNLTQPQLEAFLRYMYSGRFTESCFETVTALYRTAVEYQVESLLSTCRSYLMSNMTVGSVCEILILAEDADDLCLKQSAVSFICAYHADVRESEGWLILTPRASVTVEKALGIANLATNEEFDFCG